MADGDVRVVASGGPSPRRSAAWLPAVLATLAALIIGLVVGRATAPDHTTAAPSPRAQDAPSGPSAQRAGVPVGYPRTAHGATAALLNDSVVLSRLLLESPKRRRAALGAFATPGYAAQLEPRLARARAAAEASPLGPALRRQGTAIYRGAPLGYRVTAFTPEEARIETWAFGLVATDTVAPVMTFQTATSTMRWQDGDWKLAASDTQPGPTPRVSGATTTGRSFVGGAGRLRELRYAP